MTDTAAKSNDEVVHIASNSKSKTPYVRRLTDKRREQNRRAQKNYREKLKRKLEELEGQVALLNPTNSNEEPNENHEEQEKQADDDDIDNANDDAGAKSTQDRIINFDDVFVAAGDLYISNASAVPEFQFPIVDPTPIPTPSPPPFFHQPPFPDGLQHNDFSKTDMCGIWRMPYRPASQLYTPPPSTSVSSKDGSVAALSPGYAFNLQRHLADEESKNTHLFRTTSPPASKSPTPRPQPLPDPHLNLIKLISESNISASLSVALSLGISRDAYMQDHPSLFPACFAQFRSLAQSSSSFSSIHNSLNDVNSNTTLIVPPALAAHLSHIPLPLRPHAIQLLEAHPSYLDCIVFPRFRARAVQASVEGKLDHVEFWLDLMHGGMVCWGSGRRQTSVSSRSGGRRGGVGAGAVGKKTRDMFDQVAWSTRSWEARRWFLRKWEWLVGSEAEEAAAGDTDGIWAGSRWWWAVRGEVYDDDETLSEEDEVDRKWAEGNVELDEVRDGSAQFEIEGMAGFG